MSNGQCSTAATDDVEEIKMDGSDLPLKQEDCPMLPSPVNYNSMKGQLHEASDHNHTDAIGNNTSEQCGVTFLGLEPPCAGPHATEHTGHVVKTFNIGNSKDHVLDTSKSSSNYEVNLRKGQWSHLYHLPGKHTGLLGDPLSRLNDKLMVSVQEDSRRRDIDAWNIRHMKMKHVETERVFVDVKPGMKLNSEISMLSQDARLNILSTSSFSQFFGKKTAKGKGVLHGQLGDKTNIDSAGNLENSIRMLSSAGLTSDVMQLSQPRSDGTVDNDRVNLREWLKTGICMKNKAESLNFFRQVVELVDLAHSQSVVLQQLRPSYFILMPSNKLKYVGLSTQIEFSDPKSLAGRQKRPLKEDVIAFCSSDVKQQKLTEDMRVWNHPSSVTSKTWGRTDTFQEFSGCHNSVHRAETMSSYVTTRSEKSHLAELQLEEKWYACPEELDEKAYKFSSNIYSLGVLLFELYCTFNSLETHSGAMFDMHHRILPPSFLSENPKEAGFCLWLIHPNPSSRPTIRDVLLSDLLCGSYELNSINELAVKTDDVVDMSESELLLDFLVSLKEKKQGHATKLVEDLRCIEADLKGLHGKSFLPASKVHVERDCNLQDSIKSIAKSGRNGDRLKNDIFQLEKAYFSVRNQSSVTPGAGRADRDLLKMRENWSHVQKKNEIVSMNQKSADGLDLFFEGLCKFTCYSKFELRGTLRNGDLLNSGNVICSLSFDRDEEYIAVAGASKRIKIFEYSALLNDNIDIHYPVIEMGNESKLSCISWNSYIRNYLASTDYDGAVQVWDASTGMVYSYHTEHQKRAWSIDFSRVDPTKFASGSDDCCVKLWSTNEKKSTCTIRSPANVCCVQFSPYSSHLFMFGSADHKIYGYDLRHMRIPWCTLAGHEKTVSYVKFMDSETIVSASTDNTLKLWDLNKTSLSGMSSDACHTAFSGHTNKKHFVGLSVWDGYIACGSESNEVFTYYRSLPMPITSYKLSSIHPVSQHFREDDGLFVSSVCWRSKSNSILVANSGGNVRLLQLV